jgi:hypothetical protein
MENKEIILLTKVLLMVIKNSTSSVRTPRLPAQANLPLTGYDGIIFSSK